ncbi:MAG TPA: hypothetical protein VGT41_00395 [Candidatus Babeliales bacterium]|nr:hypothetical protein [Candidatus Babeliales bacterium]
MKNLLYSIAIGFLISTTGSHCAAAMDIKKRTGAESIHYGDEKNLDDNVLEMAIHDIWKGYFFLLRSIDQSVITQYGTREAVMQELLKQAVDQSRFMPELSDKREIIEQVLGSFAVYGDQASKQDFTLFRAADDVTKQKKYFEYFEEYFSEIGQKIKDFSDNCTQDSLVVLEEDLQRIASRIRVPKAIAIDWNYFQEKLNTLISQDFAMGMSEATDVKNQVCMRAEFIADYFMALAHRFNDEQVAIEIVNARSLGEFLFSNVPDSDLNWCSCSAAPFAKRIALAVHMIKDTVKRHPDKNKRIVYSSLAAGQLLMDFLVISGLQHQGFNNIDINVIDLDIKDQVAITALLDDLEGKRNRLKEGAADVTQERIVQQIEDKQDVAHDVLQNAVAQSIFEKAIGANYSWSKETVQNKLAHINRGIHVTIWDNAQEYVDFVQKNPQYQIDILMLVDAGGVHKVSSYLKAEGVALIETQRALDVQTQEMDLKELDDITVVRSSSKYKVAWGNEGLFAQNNVMYIPLLTCGSAQMYTNMATESGGVRLYQSIIKNYSDAPITRAVGQEIARRFRRHGYDVVWLSDPYIAYENIVCAAVKRDALIYTMDVVNRDEFAVRTQRFTRDHYLKKEEFIEPDMYRELIEKFGYRQSGTPRDKSIGGLL